MSYQVINVKVDPKFKKKVQKTADELGMPLSALIKGFLKQMVETKSVTFSASEEPSEYLKDVIAKAENELENGDTSPTFDNAEDAIKWLHEAKI